MAAPLHKIKGKLVTYCNLIHAVDLEQRDEDKLLVVETN